MEFSFGRALLTLNSKAAYQSKQHLNTLLLQNTHFYLLFLQYDLKWLSCNHAATLSAYKLIIVTTIAAIMLKP